MNLMEATIFAILISTPANPGAAGFGCRLTNDPKEALCSNDLVIKEFADGTLEFGGKVRVSKNRRRDLIFSNGITSHFDSFGWLRFSNGYAVRRFDGNTFHVVPQQGEPMVCRYTLPDRATRCS